jgi:structural maintenance of chromosomes protein 6
MSASLTGIKKTIDDYQKRIDEEAAKMAVQTQAKREESAAKLQQAREEVHDADKHLKDVCDEKRAKIAERDRIHDDGRALEVKIKASQNRVMEINETIARCAQKEKDQYVAYGTNIQGVLDDIQKMTWRGEVVGPLGMHVRVHEPAKWGPLLRSQLGNNLTSFAVTNSHDREQLKAILVRRGK